MDKQILENNFEVIYKEYKEYENYFKSEIEPIKKKQEELAKMTMDSEPEDIAELLFDTQSQPKLYEIDLQKLRNRVVEIYFFVKDVLEIPKETAKEIESLHRQKQTYLVKNGELIEIDPEHTNKIKEQAKEYYLDVVKQQMNK